MYFYFSSILSLHFLGKACSSLKLILPGCPPSPGSISDVPSRPTGSARPPWVIVHWCQRPWLHFILTHELWVGDKAVSHCSIYLWTVWGHHRTWTVAVFLRYVARLPMPQGSCVLGRKPVLRVLIQVSGKGHPAVLCSLSLNALSCERGSEVCLYRHEGTATRKTHCRVAQTRINCEVPPTGLYHHCLWSVFLITSRFF